VLFLAREPAALVPIFARAGLPAPTMHLDAVGGGPDWPGYEAGV
jgi:hypothetical protein